MRGAFSRKSLSLFIFSICIACAFTQDSAQAGNGRISKQQYESKSYLNQGRVQEESRKGSPRSLRRSQPVQLDAQEYSQDEQLSQANEAEEDLSSYDDVKCYTHFTFGEFTGLEADFNNDGVVSQGDLDQVLLNWGKDTEGGSGHDVNGDGVVSQAEMDEVLLNWGKRSEDVMPLGTRTYGISVSCSTHEDVIEYEEEDLTYAAFMEAFMYAKLYSFEFVNKDGQTETVFPIDNSRQEGVYTYSSSISFNDPLLNSVLNDIYKPSRVVFVTNFLNHEKFRRKRTRVQT